MVDSEIYPTNLQGLSLSKCSRDSGKETVLVTRGVGTYTVYKDRVYFSLRSDNGLLYSIPASGGGFVKLNNAASCRQEVYRDRIYYMAMENDVDSIRTMAIDGSGENVTADMDVLYYGIYFCALQQVK